MLHGTGLLQSASGSARSGGGSTLIRDQSNGRLRHAYQFVPWFSPGEAKQYRKFIKRRDILNLYVTSQRTGAVTGGCVKKEAPAAGPSSKTFALQFAWMLRKDEALPRSWCPLAAPAPKDPQ